MGVAAFFASITGIGVSRFVRGELQAFTRIQPTLTGPFPAAGLASLIVFGLVALCVEGHYHSPLFWVTSGLINRGRSSIDPVGEALVSEDSKVSADASACEARQLAI